jgi:hypothetical protein
MQAFMRWATACSSDLDQKCWARSFREAKEEPPVPPRMPRCFGRSASVSPASLRTSSCQYWGICVCITAGGGSSRSGAAAVLARWAAEPSASALAGAASSGKPPSGIAGGGGAQMKRGPQPIT